MTTPAANTYVVGDAKQDPDTKAVAVRCIDGLPGEWAVMTVDRGGHFADYSEVESWPDLTGRPPTKARSK